MVLEYDPKNRESPKAPGCGAAGKTGATCVIGSAVAGNPAAVVAVIGKPGETVFGYALTYADR